MRWEALFADMEAQLAAAEAADVTAQVVELTRAERSTVTLAGRLRAARERPVAVRVRGGELVTGTVVDVAEQWVLVAEGPRRALVPLAAVGGVSGLPVATQPDDGVVARRLGLGHALRALARDRTPVHVVTDAAEIPGRVDRVGADHIDVAVVVDPSTARTTGGTAGWAIPFAAIRVIRSG